MNKFFYYSLIATPPILCAFFSGALGLETHMRTATFEFGSNYGADSNAFMYRYALKGFLFGSLISFSGKRLYDTSERQKAEHKRILDSKAAAKKELERLALIKAARPFLGPDYPPLVRKMRILAQSIVDNNVPNSKMLVDFLRSQEVLEMRSAECENLERGISMIINSKDAAFVTLSNERELLINALEFVDGEVSKRILAEIDFSKKLKSAEGVVVVSVVPEFPSTVTAADADTEKSQRPRVRI